MKKLSLILIIPIIVCLSIFCGTAASVESTDVSESTSSVISSEYVSDDTERSSVTEESKDENSSDYETSDDTQKYPTEKQKRQTTIISIIFIFVTLCLGGVLKVKVK